MANSREKTKAKIANRKGSRKILLNLCHLFHFNQVEARNQ